LPTATTGTKPETDPDPDKDYNFVMMALVGMEDPGLAILPTHRHLYGFENFDFQKLLNCLSGFFEIKNLAPEVEESLRSGHSPTGGGGRGFFLYDPASDQFCRAVLKPEADLEKEIPDLPPAVRTLDVTLAERLLMIRCLNMTPEQISHQEHLEYFKDISDAINRARSGGQALILMNPTGLDDLVAVTRAGQRMPQKSTYFYPKLLTGLVYYIHNQ